MNTASFPQIQPWDSEVQVEAQPPQYGSFPPLSPHTKLILVQAAITPHPEVTIHDNIKFELRRIVPNELLNRCQGFISTVLDALPLLNTHIDHQQGRAVSPGDRSMDDGQQKKADEHFN
eukprot:CAMPEP_0170178494 /NCGR_PEP_ID=MMETSP0040_2-20121228/11924_1 /TAXON_ID=641309 /ORGANISM="Lotharella oceanica, Strain CCMP622" /LENGTH=118 /DNA_ID=CAMNT_0010421573 /DNA_START=274 /DNA_END=628 /DNA_ORIENTATION=-